MDYIEIMSYCGWDLQKSNEMAKQIIDETLRECGLEREEKEDVHTLQPESSAR